MFKIFRLKFEPSTFNYAGNDKYTNFDVKDIAKDFSVYS